MATPQKRGVAMPPDNFFYAFRGSPQGTAARYDISLTVLKILRGVIAEFFPQQVVDVYFDAANHAGLA